jgi:hypothetical protein
MPIEMSEEEFVSTTKRNPDRRFVVRLPMKANVSQLQSNRTTAIRRLHAMEKKLDENPLHRQMYNNFMEEYEHLGHMIEVSSQEDFTDTIVHYLSHHPAFKPTSPRDSSWKWPPTIKWDFYLLKHRFRAAKMFKIKCRLGNLTQKKL